MGDASAILSDPKSLAQRIHTPFQALIEQRKQQKLAQEKNTLDARLAAKPDPIMEQILMRKRKAEDVELLDATQANGPRGLPATIGTLTSPLPDLLGRR